MLKMTALSDLAPKLGANGNEVFGDSGKDDNKNLSKKSKNGKSRIQTHIRATEEPTFLTPSAKKVFK